MSERPGSQGSSGGGGDAVAIDMSLQQQHQSSPGEQLPGIGKPGGKKGGAAVAHPLQRQTTNFSKGLQITIKVSSGGIVGGGEVPGGHFGGGNARSVEALRWR